MPVLWTKTKKRLFCGGLVLFFCLLTNPAFAAAPTIGILTPSSGTSLPETTNNFTTTFSDADGWQNIKYVYLLFSTSSSTRANCFYGYYNQNTK